MIDIEFDCYDYIKDVDFFRCIFGDNFRITQPQGGYEGFVAENKTLSLYVKEDKFKELIKDDLFTIEKFIDCCVHPSKDCKRIIKYKLKNR